MGHEMNGEMRRLGYEFRRVEYVGAHIAPCVYCQATSMEAMALTQRVRMHNRVCGFLGKWMGRLRRMPAAWRRVALDSAFRLLAGSAASDGLVDFLAAV